MCGIFKIQKQRRTNGLIDVRSRKRQREDKLQLSAVASKIYYGPLLCYRNRQRIL